MQESCAGEAGLCEGGDLEQCSELESSMSDKWPLLLVSLDLGMEQQVWSST